MVMASVAPSSSASHGSEPFGPPHRCRTIPCSCNSPASASTVAAVSSASFGFYPYDAYDYPYGYYPYASSDSYADDGSCYVVQRRVHTKHGWRLQPRQVCG
jgi:hypothetical protein